MISRREKEEQPKERERERVAAMKQVSVFLKVLTSDTDHEENSEHGWPSSDGPLGKYWLRHTILSRSRDLNHRETRERFKVYARNHHSTKLQTDSFSERGVPRPIPRFRRYLLALSKPLPRSKPSRSNANADADVDANADANERAKERERTRLVDRCCCRVAVSERKHSRAKLSSLLCYLFIYLFIYLSESRVNFAAISNDHVNCVHVYTIYSVFRKCTYMLCGINLQIKNTRGTLFTRSMSSV